MRYGIVSDVHANIQAWKAVLKDMKKQGVDIILCLGDVIGYGPNPAEVLDSCYEHVDYFLLGNHDAVVGNRLDSSLFNDNARFLIEWTRDQLADAAGEFFAEMPLRMEGEGFICAHGELAVPGRFGYIYQPADAVESFTSNDSPLMFVGHTHFPAKIALDMNTNSVMAQDPKSGLLLPHERYLINVGSVGDPRDGITEASYCIFDQEKNSVIFRRVSFDIEAFRQNLLKTQLPVTPFFVQVHDGQKKEAETIKDMAAMEEGQAIEARNSPQKISGIPDEMKQRRKKVTFSSDTVAHTKYVQAREKERAPDKKGAKVLAGLAGGLALIFVIIILVVKSGSPAKTDKTIVNKASVNERKYSTQEENGDIILLPGDANIEKEEIAEGIYEWTKGKKINWTAGLKKTGWFEVFLNHNAAAAASVSLQSGESEVKVSFSAGDTRTKIGVMEFKKPRDEKITFSITEGSGKITDLKSVTLKYAGKKKPNPFGDLPDNIFADLETSLYPDGWLIEGKGFYKTPLNAERLMKGVSISGVDGNFVIASINSDLKDRESALKQKGSVLTGSFKIKHHYINLLASGGDFSTKVVLVVKNKKVLEKDIASSQFKSINIDVSEFFGEEARLLLVDNSLQNYLAVDKITFTNKEETEFSPGSSTLKGSYVREMKLPANRIFNKAGAHLFAGELEEASKVIQALNDAPGASGMEYFTPRSISTGPLPVTGAVSKSGNSLSHSSGVLLLNKTSETKEDTYLISGSFNQSNLRSLILMSKEHAAFGGGSGTGESGSFTAPSVKMKIIKTADVRGRYVRISRKIPSVLALGEVEVLGSGTNISQGKKAQQSSTGSDKTAEKALDGNKNEASQTSGKEAPFWEVDLKSESAVDGINITLSGKLEKYTVSVLNSNREIVWQKSVEKPEQLGRYSTGREFFADFNVKGPSSSKTGFPYVYSSEQSKLIKLNEPFTALVRFKGSKGYLFSKNVTNGQRANISSGLAMFPKNQKLGFSVGSRFLIPQKSDLNDNKFHTVAVTYDANKTFKFFIDGEITGAINGYTIPDNDALQFQVGTNSKDRFDGVIEYIHYFKGVKSDDEARSLTKSSSFSGNADLSWPSFITIKKINSRYTPEAPISLNKGDKYELSLNFDDTENSNLLGCFTLSSEYESTGLKVDDYISEIDQVSNYKRLFIETFKADLNKDIQLSLQINGKDVTIPVKLTGVTDSGLSFIYKKSRKNVKFSMLSKSEIDRRNSRIKNGRIIQAIQKKTVSEQAAKLSGDGVTALEKLLKCAVKKLPESVSGSTVLGRYVEVWEYKKSTPVCSWTMTAGGEKAESQLFTFSQLYPKYQLPGYAEPPPIRIYVHDFGSDILMDKIIFSDVKGDLVSRIVLVRDSTGKLTWEFNNGELRINKQIGLSLDPVLAPFPGSNKVLRKPFTQTDKESKFYGINDGFILMRNPFFYSSGGSKDFPKEVVFDLGKTEKINALRFIKLPAGATRELRFEVSTDGQSFKEIGSCIFELNKKRTEHILSVNEVECRYIKILFKNNYPDKNGFSSYYHSLLLEFEAYLFE